MTTSLRFLSIVLFLTACDTQPLPNEQPSQNPIAQGPLPGACSAPLAGFCDASGCGVGGRHYPATLSGWNSSWCSEHGNAGANVVEDPACNGWTGVSVPTGDQSDEIFYDSNGNAVALFTWQSTDSCHGACQLVCVAGPATAAPSQLTSCFTARARAVCVAPSDGGI
jgi:hypothetical protein